jgi:hypothetical protein
LNPLKLAGQCGKLKCCLNYELDSYLDAIRDFPDTNTPLLTEQGKAFHKKTDIFKRLFWYAYAPAFRDKSKEGGFEPDANDSSNWVAISVNRVKEIIEMNRQSKKPADLSDQSLMKVSSEPVFDYENVVGQDSITRLDHKKSKNKKKKKKKSGTGQGENNTVASNPNQKPLRNPLSSSPQPSRNRGSEQQQKNSQPSRQASPETQQQGNLQPSSPTPARQQGSEPQQPKPQGIPRQNPQGPQASPPKSNRPPRREPGKGSTENPS